ncbi:LysR family transcriptional regulator [Jhaorihella thermophila]|uniref:DNA-binding transcriptional regulator, LysR family n=1 Tax=Jhaorihella thermophila TaxID=488547 RepID=A0A1H5TI12_9RHOB|nr:LysR family transcriptional regulator [Jhaorihella thermophila]SEF61828.1 DNA-binding transcriptional regulator, LysR family [Jhaorihella thermophila]
MPHETLNLRHLRAFSEVVRCGSISPASSTVFLSQPAITQAIAGLERTLGIALFIRTSTGMVPTEPGQMFVTRVDQALAYLREGARRAARPRNQGRKSGFTSFDQLLTSAQLRALLAVSDTGNFSWAARNIGISQPSLHRVARDLERLAGLTLFKREARSIVLTPAARELERHARLAFSELRQGIAEINAWAGHDTAQIRIGSLPLARSFILPRAINALERQRPHVTVRVHDGAYADLLGDLRQGELDLLIGALRDPPPTDDIRQERLLDDALTIVARRGHPLSERRNLTPQDLAEFAWVVPAPGIPTRSRFDALFRCEGLAPPERLVETSSLILARGLLLDSDRLALISAHQVRHELKRGELVALDVSLNDTPRPIGITTRADWRPTATQSLLLELLRQASPRVTREASA